MSLNNEAFCAWSAPAALLMVTLRKKCLQITRTLSSVRFLVHASGKMRRFIAVHFRKKFVSQQLAGREGQCRQCGTCCNLLFTCPMLATHGRCFVYGKCRPQACKMFPITPKDLDEVRLYGRQCGFRFGNKPTDDHEHDANHSS